MSVNWVIIDSGDGLWHDMHQAIPRTNAEFENIIWKNVRHFVLLSGEPDYFGRNKISSGGDLSHYSSASLY